MTFSKLIKLINVCTKIGSGATPKGGKSAYISEGISLIRSQNVLDYTFTENGLAFINEAQAKALSNVEVQERDVLVNITGDSVARVCQVPNEYLPARVNQHVAILRADTSKLSPEFLKYSLLTKYNKDRLLSLASTGATRNALTKSMLEDFEISAPENVAIQNRIANILSTLDDKIELNRRMNQTLERMAQTLYEKYSEVDESVPLTDLIELNPKLALKKGTVSQYVEMSNLSETSASIKQSVLREYSSGAKFQNNDTLLARITPCLENGKSGFVDILSEDEVGFGSTEYIVMRGKQDVSPYFVYCVARDKTFREHAMRSMTGTSGRQRVQVDMLETYSLPKWSTESMEAFHTSAHAAFLKIKANTAEINTLTQLRDTLLPKIMLGEIDVMQMQTQAADMHEPILS